MVHKEELEDNSVQKESEVALKSCVCAILDQQIFASHHI